MKMQTENARPRGSFGIPQDMLEAANKHRDQAQKKAAPPSADEQPNLQAPPEAAESEEETQKADEPAKGDSFNDLNPRKILQKLGIDFSEDDMQSVIYKGYVEKEIEVIKGSLKAVFRTLTATEFDEVDELMGEDLKNLQMTRAGYESRQSMWIISFAVTQLAGKPVARAVMQKDGKTPDTKAIAQARRVVLGAMSGSVINKIIRIQGLFQTAVNMIVEDPDALKNS